MPIYEYRCADCGHQFDVIQKLSDPRLTDCPACHAVALQKLVSAPSFRLSGSGWYETDFKSDRDKKRNLADSSSTATSSSETKKETAAPAVKEKPAAAPTTKTPPAPAAGN